ATLLPPAAGVDNRSFSITDQFHTTNDFYGGQVGFDFECRRGHWFLGWTTKVAIGGVHQAVDVNGTTSTSVFTGPNAGTFTSPGGLLAQPTNIGQIGRDRFAVVPEVGVKVGFQVTDHLRAYAGYNFLYMSSVVRPGDQI